MTVLYSDPQGLAVLSPEDTTRGASVQLGGKVDARRAMGKADRHFDAGLREIVVMKYREGQSVHYRLPAGERKLILPIHQCHHR